MKKMKGVEDNSESESESGLGQELGLGLGLGLGLEFGVRRGYHQLTTSPCHSPRSTPSVSPLLPQPSPLFLVPPSAPSPPPPIA